MGYCSGLTRLQRLDVRGCIYEADALHTWLVGERRGGMHIYICIWRAIEPSEMAYGRPESNPLECLYVRLAGEPKEKVLLRMRAPGITAARI